MTVTEDIPEADGIDFTNPDALSTLMKNRFREASSQIIASRAGSRAGSGSSFGDGLGKRHRTMAFTMDGGDAVMDMHEKVVFNDDGSGVIVLGSDAAIAARARQSQVSASTIRASAFRGSDAARSVKVSAADSLPGFGGEEQEGIIQPTIHLAASFIARQACLDPACSLDDVGRDCSKIASVTDNSPVVAMIRHKDRRGAASQSSTIEVCTMAEFNRYLMQRLNHAFDAAKGRQTIAPVGTQPFDDGTVLKIMENLTQTAIENYYEMVGNADRTMVNTCGFLVTDVWNGYGVQTDLPVATMFSGKADLIRPLFGRQVPTNCRVGMAQMLVNIALPAIDDETERAITPAFQQFLAWVYEQDVEIKVPAYVPYVHGYSPFDWSDPEVFGFHWFGVTDAKSRNSMSWKAVLLETVASFLFGTFPQPTKEDIGGPAVPMTRVVVNIIEERQRGRRKRDLEKHTLRQILCSNFGNFSVTPKWGLPDAGQPPGFQFAEQLIDNFASEDQDEKQFVSFLRALALKLPIVSETHIGTNRNRKFTAENADYAIEHLRGLFDILKNVMSKHPNESISEVKKRTSTFTPESVQFLLGNKVEISEYLTNDSNLFRVKSGVLKILRLFRQFNVLEALNDPVDAHTYFDGDGDGDGDVYGSESEYSGSTVDKPMDKDASKNDGANRMFRLGERNKAQHQGSSDTEKTEGRVFDTGMNPTPDSYVQPRTSLDKGSIQPSFRGTGLTSSMDVTGQADSDSLRQFQNPSSGPERTISALSLRLPSRRRKLPESSEGRASAATPAAAEADASASAAKPASVSDSDRIPKVVGTEFSVSDSDSN